MSLLNAKCNERLLQELVATLPSLTLTKNWFLEPISRIKLILLDEILPKTGKKREIIESYVGHFPFSEFVYDQVSIKLREEQEYETGEGVQSLGEFYSEVELEALSQTLVAKFNALPGKYKITVPIPKHLGSNFSLFPKGLLIENSVLISSATDYFIEMLPRNNPDEKRQKRLRSGDSVFELFSTQEREWEKDIIYLQLEASGYIDQYGSTASARRALDALRSFFGLAVACKVLHRSPKYERKKKRIKAVVHSEIENGAFQIDGEYQLPESFSDVLNDLEHIKFKPEYDNNKFIENYVGSRLKLIGYAFRTGQMNEKILTASRWFFEAFSGFDEALEFVQLVIVLEVLVGDRADTTELGLGALYKNRVAYMLGKSFEERSEIMKKIAQVYSMRSKIVHNGKHSFSPSERVLVTDLREMLAQLFVHELQLLQPS